LNKQKTIGEEMKKMWLQLEIHCLLLVTAVLISCTTAKPTMEWKDPNYAGGPFENTLIVGIANQKTVRRNFENTFVDRLGEDNIKATASFAVIPSEVRPTEESIRAVINDIKFDSVLVTHLVGVEEKEVYRPPTYRMDPYRGFYSYYGYVGGYIYEPGYYTRHEQVKLETNLYDTQTEQLVWSMQSETMNPNSDKALIDAKIKTVIKHLKSQGLIVGK
jgi:hypothetical protein